MYMCTLTLSFSLSLSLSLSPLPLPLSEELTVLSQRQDSGKLYTLQTHSKLYPIIILLIINTHLQPYRVAEVER